jgi:hypothetical protein
MQRSRRHRRLRVTRGHTFASLGTRGEIHQRLTRVHGDPDLEVSLLRDPVADRERSANSALRIVLARDRRTEQRHHRVADELLHRPASALELVTQALVVRREDSLDVLRIEPLGRRREADEVGEEDADDLALGRARGRRSARGAAHCEQNLAPASFSCPQFGHVLIRRSVRLYGGTALGRRRLPSPNRPSAGDPEASIPPTGDEEYLGVAHIEMTGSGRLGGRARPCGAPLIDTL